MRRLVLIVPLIIVLVGLIFYALEGRPATVPRPSLPSARPTKPRVESPVEVPKKPSAKAPKRKVPPKVSRPVRPKRSMPEKPVPPEEPAGGGCLSGRVRNPQGNPMADVNVTLIEIPKESETPPLPVERIPEGGMDRSAQTNADGKFIFQGLSAGFYIVIGDYSTEEGLSVSEEMEIELREREYRNVEMTLKVGGTAVLRGYIRTEEGPLLQARLEVASNEYSFQSSARPNPDGSYTLGGLPAGPAEVRILLEKEEADIELHHASLELNGVVEWSPEIRLVDRVSLEVRVLDSQGRPVPQADVTLSKTVRQEEEMLSDTVRWGVTDDVGKVRFELLERGTYLLEESETSSELDLRQSTFVELRRKP